MAQAKNPPKPLTVCGWEGAADKIHSEVRKPAWQYNDSFPEVMGSLRPRVESGRPGSTLLIRVFLCVSFLTILLRRKKQTSGPNIGLSPGSDIPRVWRRLILKYYGGERTIFHWPSVVQGREPRVNRGWARRCNRGRKRPGHFFITRQICPPHQGYSSRKAR